MTAFENELFSIEQLTSYQGHPVRGFSPSRIVMAKGSHTTATRRRLAENIRAVYPQAEVIEDFATPHNRVDLGRVDLGRVDLGRVDLGRVDPLALNEAGKRTLVLAEHKSAVRQSTEQGNSCPNYWHFSPYGFCPYDCAYCYLAGTRGVRFSPTVKIFLNLPEILAEIDRVARRLDKPTAFYLGKLQDGLALDPLTGYSREMIPFFAAHPSARLTVLTKSANVENLLNLDHRGHSILSWTLNPTALIEAFEKNTPPLETRIRAMESAVAAGYPVRAVVMPIIPISGYQTSYREFFTELLSRVRLTRITLGSICSYPEAIRLTNRKLGQENTISVKLEQGRTCDGRARFPRSLREEVYRRLMRIIRQEDGDVEIGICLEEPSMFDRLDLQESVGRCNCVL